MATLYFGKGTQVTTSFDLAAPKPLDSRTVVANLTELNALPAVALYEGLSVYVKSEKKKYMWTGSAFEPELNAGYNGKDGAGLYITNEDIKYNGEEDPNTSTTYDGRYQITIFEPSGIKNGDHVLAPNGKIYSVTIVDGDVDSSDIQMVTVNGEVISIKGDSSTVAVGTVKKLAAGGDLSITNSGTDNDAVLNFGIPAMDVIKVGASFDTGADEHIYFRVLKTITNDANSGIDTAKVDSAQVVE